MLEALRQIERADFARSDSEEVRINGAAWEPYLRQVDLTNLQLDLDELQAVVSSDRITRTDLKVLASRAADLASLQRLLVATLAWGKGSGNNRLLPAFVRLLSDRRLAAALETSAAHAQDGRPALAYQAWRASGVRGLGESFFTKWLWAASRTVEGDFSVDQPRCLVLDARVWRTLGEKQHQWSSLVATAGDRSRPERYAAYTQACHRWADDLGVDAEQIEWVLFKANGRLPPVFASG
jgi:hypothetical protein